MQVNSARFDSEAYSGSLQAAAAAKQQRYQAATSAPAPFAVNAQEGLVANAPPPESLHYHKPEQTEPVAKVGG